MNMNVKMLPKKPHFRAPIIFSLKAMGLTSRLEVIYWPGRAILPNTSDTIVAIAMPIRSEPVIFFISK